MALGSAGSAERSEAAVEDALHVVKLEDLAGGNEHEAARFTAALRRDSVAAEGFEPPAL